MTLENIMWLQPLNTTFCAAIWFSTCSIIQANAPSDSLESLFELNCRSGIEKSEVEAKLRLLPRPDAIEKIVHSLRTGSARSCWHSRVLAYQALVFHDAVNSDLGRSQLMAGLDDSVSEIQQLCCVALGPAIVADVLKQHINCLQDPSEQDRKKETALRSLSGWGTHAEAAFPVVQKLLRDPTANERIRAFAAGAALRIGGAGRSLDVLLELDDTGLRESLGPLAKFSGETRGTFGTDDKEIRKKLRAFIRQTTRNPDVAIRRLALEALCFGGAYGEDSFVTDTTGGLILNPELRETLEFVARNDADDNLRHGAQQYLDRIDQDLESRRVEEPK